MKIIRNLRYWIETAKMTFSSTTRANKVKIQITLLRSIRF